MEHRWGERSAIDVPARVVRRPGIIGAGRLRNVSLTGAFLETTLPLPPMTFVEIEVACGAGMSRRFGACVVRRASDGVGLEWCDALEDVVRVLGSLSAAAASARPVAERTRRYVESRTP